MNKKLRKRKNIFYLKAIYLIKINTSDKSRNFKNKKRNLMIYNSKYKRYNKSYQHIQVV